MLLTDEWKQLRYHEQHARLWRTKSRFCAVVAGRQSGKTELSRRRVVRFLQVRKPWVDPNYFYAMPTFKQAKRVAWKKLKLLIPPDWITKISESDLTIETKFGSTLYVLGMDKPQRAEGTEFDGGILDESSDLKPEVFDVTILPTLFVRNGWCWRVGVPKRNGVGGQSFRDFYNKGVEGRDGIESYHWSSEEILTPEQIAFAKANLDAKDYSEQIGGNWEDSGGRVYYCFDDVLNVSDEVCYKPTSPIVVGSDFNVSPMAWTLGHRSATDIKIFDELYIRDTSTQETLNVLYEKYGRTHKAGFEFFGDATGRARKSSAATAAQSDYLQIRADTRFSNARIYYPKSNPAVVDRYAAVNALCCNTVGQRRLLVHPRCKNLIRDLNARTYKQGTREADDSDKDSGHITDGLGYAVHRLFPIRAMMPKELNTVTIMGN